jgi:elongation factor Ts
MAAISASMVKELRESTGAGMMDCKKALAAAEGDMEKAVEILREKGLAAAAKKAGRIAAEGLVTAIVEGNTAAIVEVNSETDFVAKNADFQAYVADVAKQVLRSEAADMEAFLAEPWAGDSGLTVAQELSEKIAVIGENLSIRRFEKIVNTEGCVVSYVHGGGRIGVLVEASCTVVNDAVKEALKNVAMQVAALKPQYVCRDEISADFIAKEKEILIAAAKNEKPDANDKIIEGMVAGRLNKELKEFCLVDQVYVKAEDGKQTVGKYLDEVSKAVGAKLTVKKFVRFETGEGLEKKQENFAEEVAKQMGM